MYSDINMDVYPSLPAYLSKSLSTGDFCANNIPAKRSSTTSAMVFLMAYAYLIINILFARIRCKDMLNKWHFFWLFYRL